MTTTTVPTLDELHRDPGLVRGLSAPALGALALKASQVLGVLCAAIATAAVHVPEPDQADRLLVAKEAAHRLGLSVKTLYARRHGFPFYVDVNGRPRFSERGIERWIQLKQDGRP